MWIVIQKRLLWSILFACLFSCEPKFNPVVVAVADDASASIVSIYQNESASKAIIAIKRFLTQPESDQLKVVDQKGNGVSLTAGTSFTAGNFNVSSYATDQLKEGDRQYSLTKQAYQFWLRFEEQRKRTGSLFDPLPASIEGNVHREDDASILALGYFGSSAVSKIRLVIPVDTLDPAKIKIRYGDIFVKEGNCQLIYSQGQLVPLDNW